MRTQRKMKMAGSIIGGADGPASIFIDAEETQKRSLKDKFKHAIYRYKKKKVEKSIIANPHSLSETVQYAKDNYAFVEAVTTGTDYVEQKKCLRESLILKHKPDILGEMQEIPTPDFSDDNEVKVYFEKLRRRSESSAAIPDDVLPMDFHLYELKIGNGVLRVEVDYAWDIFEISYSGNRRVFNKFKKISKELYSYYGVSMDDIKNKTNRYSSLVAVLTG